MKIHKPLKIDELASPSSLPQERSEFAAIFFIAYSDLDFCIKGVNEQSTDFWKRAVFRSFFSFVEFTSFRLRYMLLAGFKDGTLKLLPEEVLLLQEHIPDLNDRGAVQLKNRFFGFEAYLRFTLKIFAKHFKTNLAPNFGDGGWEAMAKSAVVRNLLTHPRTHQHLFISEEELKDLNTAMNWYFKTIGGLIADLYQG